MLHVSGFHQDKWHDNTENQGLILNHDGRFKVYERVSMILDRLIGIEVRKNIIPTILGTQILQFLAYLEIRELADGTYTCFFRYDSDIRKLNVDIAKKLSERTGEIDVLLLKELVLGRISYIQQEIDALDVLSEKLSPNPLIIGETLSLKRLS